MLRLQYTFCNMYLNTYVSFSAIAEPRYSRGSRSETIFSTIRELRYPLRASKKSSENRPNFGGCLYLTKSRTKTDSSGYPLSLSRGSNKSGRLDSCHKKQEREQISEGSSESKNLDENYLSRNKCIRLIVGVIHMLSNHLACVA